MRNIIIILLFFSLTGVFAQEEKRIQSIKNQLDLLAIDNGSLLESLKLKLDINNNQMSIAALLMAISNLHELNITVDAILETYYLRSQFSNTTVADVLLFLCKEENITIDFSGNIMTFKPYYPPPKEKVVVPAKIEYNTQTKKLSMDLTDNLLFNVFKEITLKTGINLLFTPAVEQHPLKGFFHELPPKEALNQLALRNQLLIKKTLEGYYLFDINRSNNDSQFTSGYHAFEKGYQILDTLKRELKVSLKEMPLKQLINNLTHDLKLDFYIASPLSDIRNITLSAEKITFDDLLFHAFTNHPITKQEKKDPENKTEKTNENDSSKRITYKVNKGVYFFGTENLLSLHAMEAVPLFYRSIEILGDPYRFTTNTSNLQHSQNFTNYQSGGNYNRYPSNNNFSNLGSSSKESSEKKDTLTLKSLIPEDIKKNLDIRVDTELNTFFVSGKHTEVVRFKNFIMALDQPVPVILIEVMFIEINKLSEIEAGLYWGIGEQQETTKGNLFPNLDLTLGSKNVNRIIGGLNGFGSLNVGKVIPEFFVKLKALEKNGAIRILSTPKMATLNGHRAQFSSNETNYYVVTSQNIYGTQNPQSSQIKNYLPIKAGLTLSVKPYVAGNDQVTLDIFVTQSMFNKRIAPEAPPGIQAREFSSIIRMQNKDIAILGGLEQRLHDNSGSGVPFLARIPIIKWLFSERVRKSDYKKLIVLIKPTRID